MTRRLSRKWIYWSLHVGGFPLRIKEQVFFRKPRSFKCEGSFILFTNALHFSVDLGLIRSSIVSWLFSSNNTFSIISFILVPLYLPIFFLIILQSFLVKGRVNWLGFVWLIEIISKIHSVGQVDFEQLLACLEYILKELVHAAFNIKILNHIFLKIRRFFNAREQYRRR